MPSSEIDSAPTTSVATLKSEGHGSDPGHSAERATVLDFLYHDARRVGSFLAKFQDLGLIQDIKQTESASDTASDRTTASGGFRALVHGQASHDRATTTEGRETS